MKIECRQFKFTSHAIQRMFERAIQRDAVISVVQNGEIITEYPEDEPYPAICSSLTLASVRYMFYLLSIKRQKIVILSPFMNRIVKSGRKILKQGEINEMCNL